MSGSISFRTQRVRGGNVLNVHDKLRMIIVLINESILIHPSDPIAALVNNILYEPHPS